MAWTQADLDAHYARMGLPTQTDPIKAKASKLRNVRKEIDGHKFDSGLEATAYQILRQWKMAGSIKDLRMQPTFTLQEFFRNESGPVKSIRYSADFSFFDNETRTVRYVDVKGHVTQAFARTMKMMKDKHPDITIEIWDSATVREMARR